MAGFKIDFFKGLRPRVSAKKLPVGEAQTAQNAKLGSGDLRAWDEKDAGTAVTNTYYNRTIYNYENDGSPIWLEFDDYVDIARGPIKGDALERIYYTGDTRGTGEARMTYNTIADGGGGGPYPEDFRYLGVPEPVNPPSVLAAALPETISDSNRLLSSGKCDAFVVDIVEYTTYPGAGATDDTWDLMSSATGAIAFEMVSGTALKVKAIPSATEVTFVSAENEAIALRTVNADKTTVNDWHPFEEGGASTQEADFLGFVIPEVTFTTPVAHKLRVGDVIVITTGRGSDSWLQWFAAIGTTVYQQGWDATPTAEEEGGSTVYRERNARVSASATEGGSKFTLTGNFYYDIDRTASDASEVQDRQYVYTQVTALGEEGPPSEPSNVVLALEGDTVQVYNMPHTYSTGYDIDFLRVYRTNSSEAGTEYQFVKELAVGGNGSTNPTTDTIATEDLGEVIASTTYFKPPTGMKGIIDLQNGMMAGFKGKSVYLCEPYLPHAWPPEYDQAVPYDIVGLAAFGNALAIMTTGNPSLLTGSHPRNVNVRGIKLKQACTSKESIATDKDRAFYASPDGLVEISVNGAKLATLPFVKKEEWATYSPETMIGGFHDGNYYGFYSTAGAVPAPLVSIALTGTVTTSSTEANIRTGGLTIILTLTGDTWVAAGATFDATRQDIIDGLAAKPDNGDFDWDLVVSTLAVTDVVRTSDTVVTITLPAVATYNITTTQTMTATVPGSALFLSGANIAAFPTFEVVADVLAETPTEESVIMIVGADSISGVQTFATVSDNDIDSYQDYDIAPLGSYAEAQAVAYSPSLGRWVVAGAREIAGPVGIYGRAAAWTSDDDGVTWAERPFENPDGVSGGADYIYRSEKFGFFLANGHGSTWKRMEYSVDGLGWEEIRPFDIASTGSVVQKIVYGGDRVYAVCGGGAVLMVSPDLTIDPITDVWGEIALAGPVEGIDSGEGKIIWGVSDAMYYINHSETDPATSIGTLGTTVGGIVDIVYAPDDTWVAFGEFFKTAVCAPADDPTTIVDWTTYAAPFASRTVQSAWYDSGYGFCCLTIGPAGSFIRYLYTSSDGLSWTLRKTWVEYEGMAGGAGKNEPTEAERD